MNPIISRGLIYAATYITAVIFRQNEMVVALLHMVLLGILSYMSPAHIVKTALIAGPLMTLAEYVSIKNYSMWKYNNTSGIIPSWLLITWVIVAFFIIDVYRFVQKYMV